MSASLLLTQIWSIPENGAISEPFIIKAQVADKERFLLVHVSSVRIEGRDLRLYSFRDAPPSDTLGMVKWQLNLMELLNWLPLGFEVATLRDEVQFVNSASSRCSATISTSWKTSRTGGVWPIPIRTTAPWRARNGKTRSPPRAEKTAK